MDRKHLEGLGTLVHGALRMVKMGESAKISCSEKYPLPEVRAYVYAYAKHKKKWFKMKKDSVSNTLIAERVPIPKPVRKEAEPEVP